MHDARHHHLSSYFDLGWDPAPYRATVYILPIGCMQGFKSLVDGSIFESSEYIAIIARYDTHEILPSHNKRGMSCT